jgi:hypothetical protein
VTNWVEGGAWILAASSIVSPFRPSQARKVASFARSTIQAWLSLARTVSTSASSPDAADELVDRSRVVGSQELDLGRFALRGGRGDIDRDAGQEHGGEEREVEHERISAEQWMSPDQSVVWSSPFTQSVNTV